jgi:hypothetical protein
MTLREHFDAIERKLDQLLILMGERGSRDSLDWAGELTQTEELLAEAQKRGRALHAAASDLARRVSASSSTPPAIRLLVEENGHKIWRIVQGKCLIGRVGPDGELSVMGRWAKAAAGSGRDTAFDYYVIQTASHKFVVYKRPADSSVGTIQICDDLAALEPALPADLYAEAVSRISPAQRRRPGYPELPLEGV